VALRLGSCSKLPGRPRWYPPGDLLISINNVPSLPGASHPSLVALPGSGPRCATKLFRNGREFETPMSLLRRKSLLPSRIYGRFVGSLSLYLGSSFSCAGGMRRVPCIFTSFAWYLSSCIPSSTAASWTPSTTRCIGQHRRPDARARPVAALRSGFPGAREGRVRSLSKLTLVYGPGAALLVFHVSTAFNVSALSLGSARAFCSIKSS